MKNFNYIISLFFVLCLVGCSDDETTDLLANVAAPSNLSALVTITQDNSGNVTIRPNGEGVTSYEVFFGDGTLESEMLAPGDEITHSYTEGTYTVRIVARGIDGAETEYTQQVTVDFAAPENLALIISPEPGNPYNINFTATADLETFFEITFGEDPEQTPVQFNEGTTVSHLYSTVGTYQITLTAFSGGVATTTITDQVTIFDPLLLPLTFESPTLNYGFGDFGGVFTELSPNPSISGQNTSATVAKLLKTAGSETWAGTSIALDQPIDFSSLQQISMKTYSPAAGVTILFKIENISDPGTFVEVTAVTTVTNAWEVLTFDFNAANNANEYQRIVIFYDFGNAGTGASFYFDDISQTSGAPVITLPLTFEPDLPYTFTNFGGANAEVIANPDANGINTSSKVGQLTKGNGSEVWAGAFIELGQPIDFSSLNQIKMKVWSPQAGIIVKLKLENFANPNINIEVDATTTVANGWEELSYDFSAAVNSNNYQRVVIFFDFGVAGTGANYYFDDIQLSN